MNKDVLYIEKNSSCPYMCFGSRLVKNVIQNHCSDLIVEGFGITIDNSNRCYTYNSNLSDIAELVERVGIIEIEWVDTGHSTQPSFFSIDNTRKIMEDWDE